MNKTTTMIDPTTIQQFIDALEAAGWTPPPTAEPAESEAAKVARIANELPEGVVPQWATPAMADGPVYVRFVGALFPVESARALLLGWMAEYVGGDNGSFVWRSGEEIRYWDTNKQRMAPDLLSAYAACCIAIAERRKEDGK